MQARLKSITAFVIAACPAWAAACPYCDSAIGREVAAGIFNDRFFINVVLTSLPVFVLLGIVALIHFEPRSSRPDEGPRDSHSSVDPPNEGSGT